MKWCCFTVLQISNILTICNKVYPFFTCKGKNIKNGVMKTLKFHTSYTCWNEKLKWGKIVCFGQIADKSFPISLLTVCSKLSLILGLCSIYNLDKMIRIQPLMHGCIVCFGVEEKLFIDERKRRFKGSRLIMLTRAILLKFGDKRPKHINFYHLISIL